ncbi:hypothetical protein PP707_02165 [Acetobacter pasteurianus]|nr:hypothetical protein [Acetobacter pasteurianus]
MVVKYHIFFFLQPSTTPSTTPVPLPLLLILQCRYFSNQTRNTYYKLPQSLNVAICKYSHRDIWDWTRGT